MNKAYTTPQDAEDAYYDALENGNLQALLESWEDSNDISCLLPMQRLMRGRGQIEQLFTPLLEGDRTIALSVTHIQWTESGDLAIHLVTENAEPPPGQPTVSVYALNIYRKGTNGWRLLTHQNSPTPPPTVNIPS